MERIPWGEVKRIEKMARFVFHICLNAILPSLLFLDRHSDEWGKERGSRDNWRQSRHFWCIHEERNEIQTKGNTTHNDYTEQLNL
jgi:hypothetical protein